MPSPSRPVRMLFWISLAVFSTFFAEVTAASAPLVFIKPDGWLITVIVYGLHILVLAPIIIRKNRVASWQALYLTGMLFGLYEAYMTKVLWAPPWNSEALQLGGVAVVDFIMLVFFWHPVMAFLIPLICVEWLLNLPPVVIPTIGEKWASRFLNQKNLCLGGILIGLSLGAMIADPLIVLGSFISSIALILILLWLWKNNCGNEKLDMAELLPNGKTWVFLFILLIIDYLALGILIRPEELPPLGEQATIWFVYIAVATLVFLARRKQPYIKAEFGSFEKPAFPLPSHNRLAMLFGCTFSAALASSILLPTVKDIVFLMLWGFGIPVGAFLFYRSIMWLFLPQSHEKIIGTESKNL